MSKEYKEFENAEEIWFWFCLSIKIRAYGVRSRKDEYWGYKRKCEVCDIERIIKRLKMTHSITNRHLRVMAKWGMLRTPPYYDSRAKRSEIRLWEEGIKALENALRAKEILQ